MQRTLKQRETTPLRNKGDSSDTESPIPFMPTYKRGERRRRRQQKTLFEDSIPLHHAAELTGSNGHSSSTSGPNLHFRRHRNKFEPFRKRRGKSQLSYIILLLKIGLVVVMVVYGIILWRFDKHDMDTIFDLEVDNINPLSKRVPVSVDAEQGGDSGINDRHGVDQQRTTKSDAATRAELWTNNQQEHYRERQLQHQERRTRTKPPSIDADIMQSYVKSYSLSFLSEEETFEKEAVTRSEESEHHQLPESTSICSLGAGNYLPSFPPRLALNADSTVLITGIFNRIGFHLALKLATECNVQIMIGIDPMFPNTRSNRLYILEQMSILYKSVPKFQRPVILPFVGLDPKEQYFEAHFPNMMKNSGEFDFSQFHPTHVVHLASSDPYAYRHLEREGDELKNNDLESLFGLRQSLIGLEHLLHTYLDEEPTPHFTLVSSVDVLDSMERFRNKTDLTGHDDLYSTSKLLEEILFQNHFYRSNLAHVGLRLPYVYGPWGSPGSIDFVLAQNFINYWNENDNMSQVNGVNEQPLSEPTVDVMFVDDAIDAILRAMQYNGNDSSTNMFNVLSGEKVAKHNFASTSQKLMLNKNGSKKSEKGLSSVVTRINNQLNWSPSTSLDSGVRKVLAWYLNHDFRPGQSMFDVKRKIIESGILQKVKQECDHDDIYCLRGETVLPCASECSNDFFCRTSALDEAIALSREASSQCKIIYYTVSLGHDLEKMRLKADPPNKSKNDGVCNLAFVSKQSILFATLQEDLDGGVRNSQQLVHRGWTLIPVNDNIDGLHHAEKSAIKLSPGNFFHSSIESAMYVDENFPMTPTLEDILFTVKLLSRRKDTQGKPVSGKIVDEKGDEIKYEIGSEQRHAVLLLPVLQDIENGKYTPFAATEKVDFHRAIKVLEKENHVYVGENRKSWTLQYNFFGKAQFYLNACELSSGCESEIVKYNLKHWARSNWLVHKVQGLDAKGLRCEWYKEHVHWESSVDQLSFAHIMARREIEMFSVAEGEKMPIQGEDTSQLNSDENEWHLINRQNENRDGYVRIVGQNTLQVERGVWDNMRTITKAKEKRQRAKR